MEFSLNKDEVVVYFTVHTGPNNKREVREAFAWMAGMSVSSVLDLSSTAYPSKKCNIMRILDARTKSEVSRDHLVQTGDVYAVELKENTVGVFVKVDDREPQRMEFFGYTFLHDWVESEKIPAASISRWHPIDGYVQLPNWFTYANEGDLLWIQTKPYGFTEQRALFVKRVVAAARRLFPSSAEKEGADLEEQCKTAEEILHLPANCGVWLCRLLFVVFFIAVVVVMIAFAPTPTARTVVSSNHSQPHSTGSGGNQSNERANDETIALLKDLSGQFALQRQQFEQLQAEGRAEREKLLATIGKLEERIADLHRVNVSVAPTPLFTCEPKPKEVTTATRIVGIILLVLCFALLFSMPFIAAKLHRRISEKYG
ncbi:hypothetical protein M3Y99_01092100 [Aphelenchoides fujianensis]|nr:hypothetical protein M3Y99_01092100 [Aphelenchoides fujianensis]